MKKLAFLILLLPLVSFGQIASLEKEYGTVSGNSMYLSNLSSGQYWGFRDSQSITFYSVSNYILFKRINFPSYFGGNGSFANFITEKTFNTDNKIEYLFSYYTVTGNNSTYFCKIINEDGIVLQDLGSINGYSNPYVFYLASGAKINFGNKIYSINNPQAYDESLPTPTNTITTNNYYYFTTITGNTTTTSVVTTTSTINRTARVDNSVYPNPANNAIIHLGYDIPAGSTGIMFITSVASGLVVKQINIGADFNEILLNSSELVAGTYRYYVSGSFGTRAGKTFVVN
jgi:hypothetical protein